MKTIVSLFLIISLAGKTYAQKDSLLVVNTFQYDVAYGISMFHRMCINQKTFDTSNLLLREISYYRTDSNEIKVGDIIYYFYQNNRLVSEEHYTAKAELKFFQVYQYNSADSKIQNKLKVSVKDGKPIINESQEFSYDNNIITILTRNENKKKISQSVQTEYSDYISSSTTLTKYHPSSDSIVSITCILLLKNGNKITEKTKTLFTNNSIDSLVIKNEYNERNQLITTTSFKKDVQTGKTSLDYYPDGMQKTRIRYNAENKMIEYLSFDVMKIRHDYAGLKSVYLEKYNGKL